MSTRPTRNVSGDVTKLNDFSCPQNWQTFHLSQKNCRTKGDCNEKGNKHFKSKESNGSIHSFARNSLSKYLMFPHNKITFWNALKSPSYSVIKCFRSKNCQTESKTWRSSTSRCGIRTPPIAMRTSQTVDEQKGKGLLYSSIFVAAGKWTSLLASKLVNQLSN